MTKETTLSLLRSLLTVGGSYIIGKSLGGVTVDANSWGIAIGAVITLIGGIWGVIDKTSSIEGFQSALRTSMQALGGIGVAQGLLKEDTVASGLALIPVIVPFIQSYTARAKMKQIATGKLTPCADSGKADPAGPKVK